MRILIFLTLAAIANAGSNNTGDPESITVYRYIERYAIPLGDRIREEEEKASKDGRIIGGTPSVLGQFPYQAGILATYVNIFGTGVCGGALVRNNRVLTAAHCWFDGQNQAAYFTVVLGSVTIFTGGSRLVTFQVASHPNFDPWTANNDVAVVYLPLTVATTNNIAPIFLPVGAETVDNYVGETVVIPGFGHTQDGGSIANNQALRHVNVTVISNEECQFFFPQYIQPTNMCTNGYYGGPCRGDSGGPLVHTFFNRVIMVGIVSFNSGLGCELGLPTAAARVGSYINFFSQHGV